MPRHAKGARLYLRKGRADKGQLSVWVIRDGTSEVSTGCGADSRPAAEQKLAEYIAAKWSAPVTSPDCRSDPAQVLVADVLALYAIERAPKLKADPKSTAGFVKHLLAWWGDHTLSDVRRSTCNAYVKHRTSQTITHAKGEGRKVSDQTARRELEVLSGAIGYWDEEHHLTTRPKVTLPDKPESPRDALTRAQAARLLKASLGYRLQADGTWKRLQDSSRANRKHLRRFLLLGLYTGTRHTVMTRLRWHESLHDPWVDLDKRTVYRRGKNETESATKRRPLVKMPPRLAAHMARWKRMDDDARTEKRPMVTVLHRGGRPIRGKIRTGFEGIIADAGLDGEITPHWMRHTCITWLMEGGADIWDAAGYTGMTPTMIEKHYGHHRPDHQAGAHKALGRKK